MSKRRGGAGQHSVVICFSPLPYSRTYASVCQDVVGDVARLFVVGQVFTCKVVAPVLGSDVSTTSRGFQCPWDVVSVFHTRSRSSRGSAVHALAGAKDNFAGRESQDKADDNNDCDEEDVVVLTSGAVHITCWSARCAPSQYR